MCPTPAWPTPPIARAEAPLGATASASAALVANAITVLRNIALLLHANASRTSANAYESFSLPGLARAPPQWFEHGIAAHHAALANVQKEIGCDKIVAYMFINKYS